MGPRPGSEEAAKETEVTQDETMTAMLRLPHGLHGIDRPVVLERGQAQRRVERALDHAGRAVVDVALGSGTWDVVLKQAQ